MLDIVSQQDFWNAWRKMGKQPEKVGAVDQNEVELLLVKQYLYVTQETS